MMKKKWEKMIVVFGCIFALLAGNGQLVFADAAVDWYDQKAVSYDVEVAASDGYVNIRYGPGVDYEIYSSANNGTVFHVNSEAKAKNGKSWGEIQYDGSYYWIALSQVKKVSTKKTEKKETKKALITDLYEDGAACDYDVEVSSSDGGLNLRFGPGAEYDIRVSMMPNGTVLHVEKEAKSSNGKLWGYTKYDGRYGWICLKYTKEIEEEAIEEETIEEESIEEEPEEVEQPEEAVEEAEEETNEQVGKKSSGLSLVLIILLALIVVALATVVAFLLVKK